MSTLFSFFTHIATSLAFTRLGTQVEKKSMDAHTMDERLCLLCTLGWNDFWSARLLTKDPTAIEMIATSATHRVLEILPPCPRYRRKHGRRHKLPAHLAKTKYNA